MDPRTEAPANRKDTRSELMRAKSRASLGDRPNFCPFGCQATDLDDNGYCDHLIGFTTDMKMLEPMRQTELGYRVVDGSDPQPVLKKDRLVRITTSYRVYRDDGKRLKEADVA